ncbi:hypothetical protein M408DRAFT_70528 [Serendipita vermifera MAFF 305830]|uniref:Enoyl reductase (ER) domain-containing protein n=1 Tax=Serendipita vermifera MAFF 305830 TaxID=933852 RepID=A0A0C2WNU2_SERVB|nr:hypothetical protein M408DRAFT_70528 [Serendipita vermifera MAFF 305830]
MSLPSQHRALVVTEKGKVGVKVQPLPKFSDEEILVRVRAVALNPTDWKHVDYLLKPGQSVGCDFAGDVAAVGNNAKNKGFAVGDAVAGFVRGGFVVSDNGAFQEYVVTLPESVWHKPESLPYEDAAPMGGIALSTAVQALHHRLGLPFAFEPISSPKPFLVWGGSSGVGMYAIKLASLSGYKVVTVASQHNWDLVKSLGASAVFDYKDPAIVTHIQDWAFSEGNGLIEYGLDTISANGSIEKSVVILGEGGRLITLWPPPKDLNTHGVDVHWILVYSALKPKNADDFTKMVEWNGKILPPTNVDDFTKMAEWNGKILPKYLETGKLHKGVVPLKVYTGGLDELPEAIDYVRQGKTSGQKVVVLLERETGGGSA